MTAASRSMHWVLTPLLLFGSCAHTGRGPHASVAQRATYLGQNVPGDTAVPFGTGVMGRDGYFAAERVAISRDGREIFYSELKGYAPGAPMRVRLVRYGAGKWQDPETVADGMSSPAFTSNGRRLILQDTAMEAWVADWSPGRLGPFHKVLNRHVRTHYLQQTRRGWYASSRSAPNRTDMEFSAVRFGSHDTAIVSLGAPLNTAADDADFYVAPDESYMILCSPKRGGYGSGDLFISFPAAGGWTEPKNLGPAVNTPGWEWGPAVTPDGRYLVFSRATQASMGASNRLYWIRIDGIVSGLRPN